MEGKRKISRLYNKGENIISLNDFINDLKHNMNNITRSDLQGIVEARCMVTGEDEEEILQILDKYNRRRKRC